jgi:hypothetical protein
MDDSWTTVKSFVVEQPWEESQIATHSLPFAAVPRQHRFYRLLVTDVNGRRDGRSIPSSGKHEMDSH